MAAPSRALAWGTAGHHIINLVAVRTLPAGVPPFLADPQVVFEVEAVGAEPDVLKGAGESWDADNDPGHYVDVNDDGTIAGGIALDATSSTGWAGITDKYWLTALVPPQDAVINAKFRHAVEDGVDRYQADYTGVPLSVPANGAASTSTRFFAGAKEVGLLDAYADAALGEIPAVEDIVGLVASEVRRRLAGRPPAVAGIAKALGLSTRTLQRRLAGAGKSFATVLDEVRRSRAEALLADGRQDLAAIAHELGYSQHSAFTRAAGRWFHAPPSRMR